MSVDQDVQPADSSPASESAPLERADRLGSMSETQLADWRANGIPLAKLSETPIAESSPAEPVEQAASTEVIVPPASEPGKPKSKTEARFQELLTDRAKERERGDRLERELADLRRHVTAPDVKPAVPSAVPATRSLSETLAKPDVTQPPLTEAQFFEAHPDAAYGEYGRYTARYEYQAFKAAERAEQQQTEQAKTRDTVFAGYGERMRTATAANPQLMDKITRAGLGDLFPVVALPVGTTPTIWNHLAQDVVESPVAPQLLEYLADHPDALRALGTLSEAAVHRAIGKLEAKFDASETPAPPVPTITSAPAPPPTLGSRTSDPGDPVRSALRDRDTGRYIAEMNKRDLAAHR